MNHTSRQRIQNYYLILSYLIFKNIHTLNLQQVYLIGMPHPLTINTGIALKNFSLAVFSFHLTNSHIYKTVENRLNETATKLIKNMQFGPSFTFLSNKIFMDSISCLSTLFVSNLFKEITQSIKLDYNYYIEITQSRLEIK